jgi:hypothetical protein
MIKQDITYTDFNDVERTEEFWFHLDKADLLELQAMRKGGLRAYMQEIVESDDNEKILETFKMLILRSIGKRSEDGRQFIRNDEIRDEFRNTNAYLFSLANDASSGAEFISGILPANLEKDLAKHGVKMDTVELPADTSTNDAEAKEKPVKQWTDYTKQELLEMSDRQFTITVGRMAPTEMPRELLVIAMQRKNQQ